MCALSFFSERVNAPLHVTQIWNYYWLFFYVKGVCKKKNKEAEITIPLIKNIVKSKKKIETLRDYSLFFYEWMRYLLVGKPINVIKLKIDISC